MTPMCEKAEGRTVPECSAWIVKGVWRRLTWPGWGWSLYPSRAGRCPCGWPASSPASRGASCPPPWTLLLWWSSDRWGLLPRGQSGCGCRSCLPGWTWWSSYKLRRGKHRTRSVTDWQQFYLHIIIIWLNSVINLLSILFWVQISTRSPLLMFRRKLAASSRVKWPKSTLFTWTNDRQRHFILSQIEDFLFPKQTVKRHLTADVCRLQS